MGRSLTFLILPLYQKTKKSVRGKFYFSYTTQIGSNWYMNTDVRDLKDVVFKANFS